MEILGKKIKKKIQHGGWEEYPVVKNFIQPCLQDQQTQEVVLQPQSAKGRRRGIMVFLLALIKPVYLLKITGLFTLTKTVYLLKNSRFIYHKITGLFTLRKPVFLPQYNQFIYLKITGVSTLR